MEYHLQIYRFQQSQSVGQPVSNCDFVVYRSLIQTCGAILCPRDHVENKATDSLGIAEIGVKETGPIAQPFDIGRTVKQILVDRPNKGCDLSLGSAERVCQKGVQGLRFDLYREASRFLLNGEV